MVRINFRHSFAWLTALKTEVTTMQNTDFFEQNDVTMGLTPVDLSAAANNGGWVDVKPFDGIAVIFIKAAGTAGQDPTFTLKQATSNTGGSSKDLDFTKVYRKQGATADEGNFTIENRAADNEYTNGTLAENKAIIGVYIRADSLDVDNGFDHMRIEVPDVGANAQLGCCIYIGTGPNYSGAQLPRL